jgi:hypothetical protein
MNRMNRGEISPRKNYLWVEKHPEEKGITLKEKLQ